LVRVRVGWQTSCAYIHPCKHSSVMKKIILRQAECGKESRVDQYVPRLYRLLFSPNVVSC
jgi:hypothetical protein